MLHIYARRVGTLVAVTLVGIVVAIALAVNANPT